ncbi:OmpA family protein [Aliiglaciecola sp. CAU 1673]|uniref:OmpA family protein n=1 Tax=Aliiglaciecola sp. CAU 1673 TaxID=3032595 RepID=UPI0023DBA015|nr:OmpA family protein [Aliiglaciecola sp. CAU 1673]MDF2180370.1 OmpA family protein [Aliiglaciecola sp. CAU 1673]
MNAYTFVKPLLLTSATVLLVACTTAPTRFAGADAARERMDQLQSNKDLAHQAPMAMSDARMALLNAEQRQKDPAVSEHLVFIAERKVDIAEAEAKTQHLQSQRSELTAKRDAMQLQARTKESQLARSAADQARQEASEAQRQTMLAQQNAATAQRQMNEAEQATADAREDVAMMQRQLEEMDARRDARGTIVTLGDVLFDFSKADINPAAISHLAKLAAFLNTNTDRNVIIEGHTDNVGGEEFNLLLSQRRANAVKDYLQSQGVAGQRLETVGKGALFPVTDNISAASRQQNRRVEVIITDPIT